MSNTTKTPVARPEPWRPSTSKAQKPPPAFKPQPSGLSREELQKLVTEMIG